MLPFLPQELGGTSIVDGVLFLHYLRVCTTIDLCLDFVEPEAAPQACRARRTSTMRRVARRCTREAIHRELRV